MLGSRVVRRLFPKVNRIDMSTIEKPTEATANATNVSAIGMAATLLAVFVATHWGTLRHMVERWTNDPQYSHGFIVPIFALIVLWSRRDMLKAVTWQPAWSGIGLLGIGVVLRFIAVQPDIEPLDALSLMPTVFGLVLLVGGWSVLGWSWPALAFLA